MSMEAKPGGKQKTRTVQGCKEVTTCWPGGLECVQWFAPEGRLRSETTTLNDVSCSVTWEQGWRSERYRQGQQSLSRGEYEALRLELPQLPASQGYPGVDSMDVIGIQLTAAGRSESFRQPDGSEQTLVYDPSGSLTRRVVRRRQGDIGLVDSEDVLEGRRMVLYTASNAGGKVSLTLRSDYRNGELESQSFLKNHEAVSRRSYEKLRLEFPDLPAADMGLDDTLEELQRWARAERKAASALAAKADANPAAARQHEGFCRALMAAGHEPGDGWIKQRNNTLGERGRQASLAFMKKLYALGATQVFVCDIEQGVDDEGDNAAGLVLAMPDGAGERAGLLKLVSKLSQEQGFDPVVDNGQNLQYLKLD